MASPERRTIRSIPWSAPRWTLALLAMAAAACGAAGGDPSLAEPSDASTAAVAEPFAPTYYVARSDLRMCPSPTCGGFWVSAVNKPTTICADGKSLAECYVAALDLAALKLSPAQESQVRGAIGESTARAAVVFQGKLARRATDTLGALVASQAWLAPVGAQVSGTWYGLAPSGIVCITTPCPVIRETTLNVLRYQYLSQVDLSRAPGTEKDKAAALAAMMSEEGLVATGYNQPVIDRTGARTTILRATQYFRRVLPAPDPCDGYVCEPGTHCEVRQVECFTTPCPPLPVCVPDPVRCGGFLGIKCPGLGECVDDPSDTCDPATGGADCGGICQCKADAPCREGSTWDGSAQVCACVPSPSKCGDVVCPTGQVCCNPVMSICTPPGMYCIQ